MRTRVWHVARALKLIWGATRRWTAAWLVLLVVQGALPAVLVYLTKVLIDRAAGAVGTGLSWTTAGPVIEPALLMGGLLLFAEGVRAVQGWVQAAQAELLEDHVVGLVHEKAAAVDLAFYESPAYHDLMVQANGSASTRMLSILEGTGGLIQNGVTLLGVAGLLVPYGAWLPLLLLASTLPALWVVVHHRTRQHDWWAASTARRRWTHYFDFVLTHPFTAAEVRLLDLTDHFRAAYADARRALRTEQLALQRRQSGATFGAGLVSLVVVAGALAWMLSRVLRGLGTLGDLALFYQAFTQGQGLMRSLLGTAGGLYGDSLFLEHLFSFLALESTVTDPDAPHALPDAEAHAITFDDVSFRYPGSDAWALRHFSLHIPAGRTVALVGPNGAGKSTFLKLLCRLYDPQEGRILLDGVDLRDVPVRTLRRHVAALLQEPFHYTATAADNIRYGDADAAAPDAAVRAAARAGGAHEIIADLPQGYDTLLGKEFVAGAELSGGQWQRLTLARAFYRKAPVVLLDEPTSFMDSWAEMEWLDAFRPLVAGRTALIITHRFTTAMRADVIHVLADGQVIESGSHDELLAAGGRYAASWRAQTHAHHDTGATDAPASPTDASPSGAPVS